MTRRRRASPRISFAATGVEEVEDLVGGEPFAGDSYALACAFEDGVVVGLFGEADQFAPEVLLERSSGRCGSSIPWSYPAGVTGFGAVETARRLGQD